ncbi:MAG TPA: PBP1A family penicillin-binding protein [Steroidobacteraceae bacterium]|nr:PBP1A family penicillin-binding protein [Steroidobacteraceae bacterium]
MITPLERRLRIAATVIVSIAGLVGLAFLATYYYLKPTLPDVAVLRDVRLQVPLRVYSRDGKLLAQLGEQRRVPVTWDQIPPVVVHAVLAAEDDRFFQHPGVDWQGIVRAVFVAATTMQASQGGSTLTQQLVRTTLITKEKQLRRKLREVYLALSLENELSKQEIFTLFVNTQFLGQRSYGFAAASETYFGKTLSEVDASEAALLAGILQAPSRQNPVASVELATERRTYVLRRMRELGYLNDAEWQAAMDEPVARGLHGPRVQIDAPYVGEMVRVSLYEKYGDRIYSEGFQVVTTVDSRLQRAADVALRSAVLEYDRRHGWRGPSGHVDVNKETDEALAGLIEAKPVVGGLIPAIVVRTTAEEATVVARSGMRYRLGMDGIRWARKGDVTPTSPRDVVKIGDVVYILPSGEGEALLVQIPEVQGAIVALDPHDGSVVALSGGFDYDASKFNRVTQARRQPGSSFKPFIYSAALEAGLTPASVILDAPVVYEAPDASVGIGQGKEPTVEGEEPEQEDWRPGNDTDRFYGPTRLRDALARSRNLVTIRVMRQIGVAYARDYVTRFGLPKDHIPADLTAALGTAQLTPLEMADGFAVFANGGQLVKPHVIDRILAADGSVLEQTDVPVECLDCATAPTPFAAAPPAFVAGTGAMGVVRAADVGGKLPLPEAEEVAPRAISEANAWIITDMLRDVIRRGTGQRARALGRGDLAGKTGTTQQGRDAWFSGFSPDLVATAWVGFDQERPLGSGEEGARTALPMWIYFMREALAGVPQRRLPMPDGVVTARVAQGTPEFGEEAPAEFEYFLADHLPPGVSGANTAEGEQPAQKYEEPIF